MRKNAMDGAMAHPAIGRRRLLLRLTGDHQRPMHLWSIQESGNDNIPDISNH